ncbi:MAG: XTP/dITP diphosphatase [Oscillospiraceae bacterium]|nr:XTP/dITP diphosphatase [Oscillospiraceae bacterium]
MEFIAATNNQGKLKELRRILVRMGHTVCSLQEAGLAVEVEETGETFSENAKLKADTICKLTNKPTIADDSGLEVEALGGAPGVYSARYAGVHGDDEANNDKLLLSMRDVPQDKRAAQFVSVVAVTLPGNRHLLAKGVCKGEVGFARKGTNGFGYDPIFTVPQYGGRSYAELSDDEKDTISHRGKALAALEKALPALISEAHACALSAGFTET